MSFNVKNYNNFFYGVYKPRHNSIHFGICVHTVMALLSFLKILSQVDEFKNVSMLVRTVKTEVFENDNAC